MTSTARDRSGTSSAKVSPRPPDPEWEPAADRPSPVDLLVEQNRTREPDLVPVRHGRMLVSPFTFYRGAAKIMATDLANTQTAGLQVQLCGDAHLSNFGGFGSPERQLVFDLNDFDETLPGPFEYDLKRLATSFTIAARNNGFTPKDSRGITRESVKAYRQAMADFASMGTLDVWYAHMSDREFETVLLAAREDLGSAGKSKGKRKGGKKSKAAKAAREEIDRTIAATTKAIRKARKRDSSRELARLTEVVDGKYRIVSQPLVMVPLRDVTEAWGMSADETLHLVENQFRAYKASLSADRRHLLEKYTVVDVARKVAGVGSVGTRAFIVLLQGRDIGDPLFLQVKEATRSVLEDHLPKTQFHTPGQRVVEGQRLMQAAPDILLGWTKGVQDDRFYYWRQLRDMKVSAEVETMTPLRMTIYARMCGWTLAHAHARSGDPVAISEYLGADENVDRSIAAFAERYADQNLRDYETFAQAIADGRIEAMTGV
jgi:uncharacterized protein (DUF2252 family)